MEDLQSIIARLQLEPLPREGGWFRQYHLSAERDAAGRPRVSSIHFLMTPAGFSAMHRLKTPEVWTFRDGAPAELLLLEPGGTGRVVLLGSDTARGQQVSVTVPGGVWQGAQTRGAWTLADCTMSPAWDETEFELGEREYLLRGHPEHGPRIRALTRV